jgi:hypothetical protein
MNVLVFKTSVQSLQNVKALRPKLNKAAGRGKWNFALDDCDRILRITSSRMTAAATKELLMQNGFDCSELED